MLAAGGHDSALSFTLSRLQGGRKKMPTGVLIMDVPNICLVFASVPNSAPNTVFVFGRIVSSKRIRIVSLYMYSAASNVYG